MLLSPIVEVMYRTTKDRMTDMDDFQKKLSEKMQDIVSLEWKQNENETSPIPTTPFIASLDTLGRGPSDSFWGSQLGPRSCLQVNRADVMTSQDSKQANTFELPTKSEENTGSVVRIMPTHRR